MWWHDCNFFILLYNNKFWILIKDAPLGRADCGVFGGWPYLALQYVIRAGGLPAEKDYPYCVGDGSCLPVILFILI